jgi:hypothetical protein
MRLLTLAAIAGLAVGIRHLLAHRAASRAPQRRPIIGTLAKKVRDVAEIPDNVTVTSHKGVVTLKGGPVPRADVDRALAAVLAVPGVHEVRNYVQTEGDAPEAAA